ncbi:MAG: hypothetical protein AVDCRST_MAG05-4685, partial [uncultured Rubrobacteraceae bacterium]
APTGYAPTGCPRGPATGRRPRGGRRRVRHHGGRTRGDAGVLPAAGGALHRSVLRGEMGRGGGVAGRGRGCRRANGAGDPGRPLRRRRDRGRRL